MAEAIMTLQPGMRIKARTADPKSRPRRRAKRVARHSRRRVVSELERVIRALEERLARVTGNVGSAVTAEGQTLGLPDMLTGDQKSPAMRARTEALADLARHGYSEAEISALVVARRTLARRRAAGEPLTVEETDKALRLQRVAAMAERVFGEPARAHRWMRKPKRALAGETPLAFLASETGARVVEGMLHRIEHGMYA